MTKLCEKFTNSPAAYPTPSRSPLSMRLKSAVRPLALVCISTMGTMTRPTARPTPTTTGIMTHPKTIPILQIGSRRRASRGQNVLILAMIRHRLPAARSSPCRISQRATRRIPPWRKRLSTSWRHQRLTIPRASRKRKHLTSFLAHSTRIDRIRSI